MTLRLVAVIVTVCLYGSTLRAQSLPDLTRPQRELLQHLLSAVDRAAASPSASGDAWSIHVLRASDGSHYVAFSATPPPASLPNSPLIVYVRLATATAGATTLAERSLVREWLQGSRTDPRLLPRRGGMAVGEMPVLGAGGIAARGAAAAGSSDLQTMAMQRERARERRDDEEKKRRAALEGGAATPSDRLPFEDFEVTTAAAFADGTRTIQRALTAGPGTYDLFVAWADASEPPGKARVHVSRRSLQLSAASADLGISTVIVADRISVRPTPYSAVEQRAHPYSIGATEIVPARDTTFTPDERLSVAFQIVNPAPGEGGKPDLVVNLRIVRVNGMREESIASLSPLTYNAASLPADFDARLGHPIIAAMAVPLATIPRGDHRLLITVEDRTAKTVASSRAEFSVAGSAASLLAEAPSLAPKFDLAAVLDPAMVAALMERLAPASPSPALNKALQTARTGRFADLLIEERVAADEQGVRAALTGLALLSVGDLGAIAYFERARAAHAAPAVIDYLLGAARAAQNRDADAIERWRAALAAGLPRESVDQWLAEAYLRSRDVTRAASQLGAVDPTSRPSLLRTVAATRIADRREADAVAAMDAVLARTPDDLDARWLLVHALYARLVREPGYPRDRFVTEARRYIDAKGRHSALAADWLAIMSR